MTPAQAFVIACSAAIAACGPSYQAIRMDVPAGAIVRIPAGSETEELSFSTPFTGQFQIGSLAVDAGIPVVFELDQVAAAQLGGSQPISIYARLSVGEQTDFSQTQTLRLGPSEDSLRSLVRGDVSEITAFVTDPDAGNQRLAIITMRLAPF